MNRLLHGCVLLVLLLTGSGVRAEAALEVIPLHYRTVDEVLPLVRPFLEPGGTAGGMGSSLILRTSPRNLAEIRKILATVDAPPRQLLISVRQTADRQESGSGARLSGSVGGPGGRVVLPEGRAPGGAVAEVRRGDDVLRLSGGERESRASDAETQRIQVLEGRPAFIRVGQSVAVPQRQIVRTPGQVVVVDGTVYQDATRGFSVLPRITGDTVTLEIVPERNQPGAPGTGERRIQEAATVISGRLGEWIELGGVSEQHAYSGSLTGGAGQTSGSDTRRILIRVDEVRRP